MTTDRVSDEKLREILARKPVSNALLRTTELQAIVSELLALRDIASEASFLADRITDLEWHDEDSSTFRDFAGHVDPSVARLSALLTSLKENHP